MPLASSDYTHHTIVNVFRSVARLVSRQPELMDTQGVFRVGGARPLVSDLLQHVMDSKYRSDCLDNYLTAPAAGSQQGIHVVLGLLPFVLKNKRLLQDEDPIRQTFSRTIQAAFASCESPDETRIRVAGLLDEFICKLLLSPNLNNQRSGEILYHYCYLMHVAQTFSKNNLMTSDNLGIVLSPHFSDEAGLYLGDDLLMLGNFMKRLQPALSAYIASPLTEQHFEIRHAGLREHLMATRRHTFEKLKQMKEVTHKIMTAPIQERMMRAAMLKQQIDAMDEQRHDTSLPGADRKRLRRELKERKHEKKHLEKEISALAMDVKHWNRTQVASQSHLNLTLKSMSDSGDELEVSRSSELLFPVAWSSRFFGHDSDSDEAIQQAIQELELLADGPAASSSSSYPAQ